MFSYFISDLHLSPDQTELTTKFIKFMQGPAREADAVYILGDLFEAWLGDDNFDDFIDKVKTSLLEARSTGVAIFFMHGNRDFLIGRGFCRTTGVTLLPDPFLLELYQHTILLTHGDLLCTDDKAYQWFRLLARNSILQSVFLLLPLAFRKFIARRLRKKSSASTNKKPLNTLDANVDTANLYFKKNHCQLMIHGHTHQPNIHQVNDTTRIVLGSWEHQGEILQFFEDGHYQLLPIDQVLKPKNN